MYRVKTAFNSGKYSQVKILVKFLVGLGDHVLGQVEALTG